MPHPLDRLDADLAERVAAFAEVRSQLEAHLGGFVGDPPTVTDDLISHVEEYGVDHVLEHLDGAVPPDLAANLERLVEAQDQIDQALLAREAVAREIDGDRAQRVSVQGEIYRINQAAGQQPELVREEPAELSLTQQYGLQHDVAQAQPLPDTDRSRNR